MVKPLMLGRLVGGEVFVFQRFGAFPSSRLAVQAEANWERSRPKRENCMAVDCIGFENQLLPCGAAILARRKPCEAWSLSRAPVMVFLGIFGDARGSRSRIFEVLGSVSWLVEIMRPRPKLYLEAGDGVSGLIRDGGGIFASEIVSQSGVSRQGSARREGRPEVATSSQNSQSLCRGFARGRRTAGKAKEQNKGAAGDCSARGCFRSSLVR